MTYNSLSIQYKRLRMIIDNRKYKMNPILLVCNQTYFGYDIIMLNGRRVAKVYYGSTNTFSQHWIFLN